MSNITKSAMLIAISVIGCFVMSNFTGVSPDLLLAGVNGALIAYIVNVCQ